MKVIIKSVDFLTNEKHQQEVDFLCDFNELDKNIDQLINDLRSQHLNTGYSAKYLDADNSMFSKQWYPLNFENDLEAMPLPKVIKKWFNLDENPFYGFSVKKN